MSVPVVDASHHSPIPSAIPRAQAASTLPPRYSTAVSHFSPICAEILASSFWNSSPARTSKLVAILLPTSSSTDWMGPVTGTWT